MKNLTHNRTVYERVIAQNPNLKNKTSYSYLRLQSKIENTKNLIKFDLLKTGGEFITEKKLDKNDKFYMSYMGLFLARVNTTEPGKAVLQTYPNETVFAAVAGPPAFVPGDLELIYNGFLTVKVGTTEHIPATDMRQFREVTTTQQSSASNKSEANSETGMKEVDPTFALDGSDDTEIKVEVPIKGTIAMEAVTASIEHHLVFFTRGFLVKGGAHAK